MKATQVRPRRLLVIFGESQRNLPSLGVFHTKLSECIVHEVLCLCRHAFWYWYMHFNGIGQTDIFSVSVSISVFFKVLNKWNSKFVESLVKSSLFQTFISWWKVVLCMQHSLKKFSTLPWYIFSRRLTILWFCFFNIKKLNHLQWSYWKRCWHDRNNV